MTAQNNISLPVKVMPQAAASEIMPAQEPLKQDPYKEALQYLSVQRKLSIGSVDDPMEEEADAMADKIMQIPEQNFIQRKCSHCEEEEIQRKPLVSFIQRKASTSGTCAVASDTVTAQINASKGNGGSMDSNTQSFMQSRFGTNFSDVKIHTGGEAIQMNSELNAKAFTVGNDIYFNEGQYNPGSDEGKYLIAHELTHVVQNSKSLGRKLIQRAMKFELQTANVMWRILGKTKKELPRKFGPHDFMHKGSKGKPAKGSKEGSAIELQSEHGGFVEFETPKWFRSWCEVKERIQEAVDMTNDINASKTTRTQGGVEFKLFPFNTKRLVKSKAFPEGLKSGETIEVQIKDKDWHAKIQASEGIEIQQYESLLKEHEKPTFVSKTIGSARKIVDSANTAKLPDSQIANLLGFLQMIVNYILRGQKVPLKGSPSKFGFRLMSRTSFSSIFDSILSSDEQKIFRDIVSSELITTELGLDKNIPFFVEGHGSEHHEDGPTINEWLTSITGKGKDLLSHPKGGSEAMGRFEVENKAGEKDTNLVKFEARGSATHGDSTGSMSQPASNWVKFIENIFKSAFTNRNRKGSTELKFDPTKCP